MRKILNINKVERSNARLCQKKYFSTFIKNIARSEGGGGYLTGLLESYLVALCKTTIHNISAGLFDTFFPLLYRIHEPSPLLWPPIFHRLSDI